MLTISSYRDPTYLYRWMRSLRESGATCDVVVFTDDAQAPSARAVASRYGAQLVKFIPSQAGVDPAEETRVTNQMYKHYKCATLLQWPFVKSRSLTSDPSCATGMPFLVSG